MKVFKFFVKVFQFCILHIILISGSKSVKFAHKFRIFLEFLTLEGTLASTLVLDTALSVLNVKQESLLNVRQESFSF